MSPGRLRVLVALLVVYERDGRATIPSVMEQAGLRSKSTVLHHLRRLRAEGFCTWDDGLVGTLRPMVRRVA